MDAGVFSSENGAGDAPAGLLNGATAVSGTGSLIRDLQALAASVSAGGSGQVVFVGGPSFASAASLDGTIKATILGSQAVAETMLVAVDPLSLIWGTGTDPDIYASAEGVVHMSDDPDAIVESAVTADPVRGLFQTDCMRPE